MPLRDHFRPPLDNTRHWEGFLGQWPGMIVLSLLDKLPERYFAEPRVHSGGSAEIDETFHEEHNSPPRPTLSVPTSLPAPEECEVRVFDTQPNCRLVAAVAIVSPANKARPGQRGAFIAKCASLIQQRASVTIVDVVTVRNFNLYSAFLELVGGDRPVFGCRPASALRRCLPGSSERQGLATRGLDAPADPR